MLTPNLAAIPDNVSPERTVYDPAPVMAVVFPRHTVSPG